MSVIARLLAELRMDAKNFNSGADKAANEAKKMGDRITRDSEKSANMFSKIWQNAMGFVVANVFMRGAQAIGGFFSGMIGGASDYSESLSKVGVVYGDQAQEIINWSKDSADALGISQGAALEYAGTIGNLLKGVGVGNKDLPMMSENILQAAADLGSFNNVDPGQVFEDLRSGLVGEAEPLRKYGILINEAAVSQKAMELGLVGANGEISEGAKVQARYALIMDQLGPAMGDFSRTQDGLANGSRILTSNIANLQVWLGKKLTPTIARGVAWVNGMVRSVRDLVDGGMAPFAAILAVVHDQLNAVFGKSAGEQIYQVLTTIIDAVQDLIGFLPTLASFALKVGKTLVPVLGFIADHFDYIGPAIVGAVAGLKAFAVAEGIVTAVTAVLNLTLSPLVLTMLAVAAIAAVVAVAWYKNWFGIREKTAKVIGWLASAFVWLVNLVQPVIDIVKLLGEYWYDVATHKIEPGNLAKLPGWLQPIALIIGRLIKTVRVFVKTWQDKGFLAALKTIPMQIKAFGRAFAGLFDAIGLGRFADGVRRDFALIAEIISRVVSLVDNIIHGRWKKALNDLAAIGKAAVLLFINRFRTLGGLILDVVEAVPWSKIGKYLVGAGGALIVKLWEGMNDLWDGTIKPWVSGLPGQAGDYLKAGVIALWNAGVALFNMLKAGLAIAWVTVWTWIKERAAAIVRPFVNMYSTFYAVGASIIKGITDALSSGWNSVKAWGQKIIDYYNGIASKVPGMPTIGGGDAGSNGGFGGGGGRTPSVAGMAQVSAGSGRGGDTYHVTVGDIHTQATNGKQLWQELMQEVNAVRAGST